MSDIEAKLTTESISLHVAKMEHFSFAIEWFPFFTPRRRREEAGQINGMKVAFHRSEGDFSEAAALLLPGY